MKRLILTALLALSLHAETVYITAHGKTWHTNRQCMRLVKSKQILTTDDSPADNLPMSHFPSMRAFLAWAAGVNPVQATVRPV